MSIAASTSVLGDSAGLAARSSRCGRARGSPRDARRPGGRSGRRLPVWPRSISGANSETTGRWRRCSSSGERRPVLIVSRAWNGRASARWRGAPARALRAARRARLGIARCLRDLRDRVLHDGVEERLAGREVDVDRGADDTRPASDLGHAGIGIARQRLERCGEDRRNAAVCVRAAAPRRRGGCRLLCHLSEPASRLG